MGLGEGKGGWAGRGGETGQGGEEQDSSNDKCEIRSPGTAGPHTIYILLLAPANCTNMAPWKPIVEQEGNREGDLSFLSLLNKSNPIVPHPLQEIQMHHQWGKIRSGRNSHKTLVTSLAFNIKEVEACPFLGRNVVS